MCGICGYTDRQDPDILQNMMKRMAHRGPDDSGSYHDDAISFGMVRLSIIDIAGGHQPLSNEDGTVYVVFNGEIFNYLELKKELESAGHCFKTSSDTETIIHAYEEYGTSFLHKLNGMFSIALWDSRIKTLLVARDRFGVKPLFFMVHNNNLVFGSEIKALLQHPAISRELDHEALSHYLSLRNIPAPFTVYKDVKALPPGHLIVWRKEGLTIDQWYKLRMENEWSEHDSNDLIDRIDSLLRDSIRLRLRSDVDYGAYLSGGIDSSTVVGIMSEYSPKPVKTFCLAFADSPAHKQDAHYARTVAEKYSTEHYEYVMSWKDLAGDMHEVLRHLDQPFAGVISSFWLSRFMSNYVTVALSGDGADDLFASYGHHRLVWPIKAVMASQKNGSTMDDVDFGFYSQKKDFVIDMARYAPWEWRLSHAAFMEHEKATLLSETGREIFLPYSTSKFLKNIYQHCNPSADELNNMLYLDLNTLLPNEILYFNDMLSMAHSMEVRTPFLDFRIVELACAIPGKLKIKDQTLKYILRKVAARYLPQEILTRPKEGFVLPKNTWLRQPMAMISKDILSKERLSLHGYFNQGYIDFILNKLFAGDDSVTFKIWTLIVFQIWYENHLSI